MTVSTCATLDVDKLVEDMIRPPGSPENNISKVTLYDLLQTAFPPSYPIHPEGALNTNRGVNEADIDILDGEQLETIVFAPDMLHNLLETERQTSYPPLTGAEGIRTVIRIHPEITNDCLSPFFCCMNDITLHVYLTLLRPIMAALHVFIVLSHVEDSKQSYLSSLPPPEDYALLRYVEDPSSDKPRIEPLVPIAFTSKNVFVSRSDDGDSATLTDNYDANELLAYLFRTSSTEFSKGSAVNFHWPSTVSHANKEEVTKALIPLWRKLARSKLGVLSSFDKTVFLVREKRTLFISSAYRAGPLSSGEVSPMLATYCFFKYASGYYVNEGLCLPNIYPEDKSET